MSTMNADTRSSKVAPRGSRDTDEPNPPELRGAPPPGDPELVSDVERRRIQDALDRAGGRKGVAAEMLGISRSTLWRKLREHRLA